jgi:glyoxylase-like metal-dependent hydrolase (beta-lactamase superfamily II)
VNTETHNFNLGRFECIAVSDGTMTYAPPTFPPPAMFLFLNAPPDRRDQVLTRYGMEPGRWGEWISPYTCLVVSTGEHIVLVDTGAGGLGPNTGKLLQNLHSESIDPDDIDTVILTHGHPDHIGGITDAGGKVIFRKAHYVMWKDEWDFWTTGRAEKALDEHSRGVLMEAARRNLPPIQEYIDLISEEKEIVPGIKALAAPGHTPGQMALDISSEGERLLYTSDVVLHPVHVEQPGWHAAVDLNPDQVTATRRKFLRIAASEKALVLAFHFPFPGLGRVMRKGESWQWRSLE